MAFDKEILDMNRIQREFSKLRKPARKYLLERLQEELDNPPINDTEPESDTPIADEMETPAPACISYSDHDVCCAIYNIIKVIVKVNIIKPC